MSARDDAVNANREAAVTATVRLARELREQGLIVRRIGIGPDGVLSVDIAGYESPDQPTVAEQPRFSSYGERFEAGGRPSDPNGTNR